MRTLKELQALRVKNIIAQDYVADRQVDKVEQAYISGVNTVTLIMRDKPTAEIVGNWWYSYSMLNDRITNFYAIDNILELNFGRDE